MNDTEFATRVLERAAGHHGETGELDWAEVERRAARLRAPRQPHESAPAIAAAMVMVMAVSAALITVTRGGDESLRTGSTLGQTDAPPGSPAPTVVGPAPLPAEGLVAWLVPPRHVGDSDLGLVQLETSWSSGVHDLDTTIGTFSIHGSGGAWSHTTIFRYARSGEDVTTNLASDPTVRATAVSNTTFRSVSSHESRGELAPTVVNGWKTIDLGEVCAPNGARQLVVTNLLVTFTPCRHVLLGWTDDFVVIVDALPGTEIGQFFADAHLTTLETMASALRDVAGVDLVKTFGSQPIPPVPDPTEGASPAPGASGTKADSPFCQAWADVLDKSRDKPLNDPALHSSMAKLAELSPPGLAADIRLLAQQWNSPTALPPESAEIMARVMNAAAGQCGGGA